MNKTSQLQLELKQALAEGKRLKKENKEIRDKIAKAISLLKEQQA